MTLEDYQMREQFELFEEEVELVVEHDGFLSQIELSGMMPDGMEERVESGDDLTNEDVIFISKVFEEYTNWELEELVEEVGGFKTGHVFNIVLSVIMDVEVESWEDFDQEDGDSVFDGGLGVTDD
jgi:hypothetical protein